MPSPTPPGRRRLRYLLLGLATLLGAAFASESFKFPFDVPADSAERAIKRLSEQSGVDVLLPTNLIRGVRTRAVKGNLTASEALDSMFAGTGFVAARDEKSGALTVRRESRGPKVQRAAHPGWSDRPMVQTSLLELQKP